MSNNIPNETLQSIDLAQLDAVVGGDWRGFWNGVSDTARYVTGAASAVVTAPLALGRGIAETAGALGQGHSVRDSVSSGIVQSMNTTGVLDRDSRGPIPRLSEMPAR